MLAQSEIGKVCRIACPLLDPLLTLPSTEQLRANAQAQPCDNLPRQEAALALITTPEGPNAVTAANARSSEETRQLRAFYAKDLLRPSFNPLPCKAKITLPGILTLKM